MKAVIRITLLCFLGSYILGTAGLFYSVQRSKELRLESGDVVSYINQNSDVSLFYLNYWAPFCEPCIEHFEVLERISSSRRHINIVAICNQEFCTREEAHKYEEKYRINFLYETGKTDTAVFPKSLLADNYAMIVGTLDGIAEEEMALDYYLGGCELNFATFLLLPRAIRMVMQHEEAL
ncbi:MAG: hypothetical protein ABIJ09_13335 [Pseudomonadota bacterium]